MDRLTRLSSGICETSSGALGIVPLKVTRIEGDLAWFQYTTQAYGPSIRVEWHRGVRVAVFERDVAAYMLNQRYARNPTEDEVAEHNAIADAAAAAAAGGVSGVEPTDAPDAGEEAASEAASPAAEPRRRGRSPGKKADQG